MRITSLDIVKQKSRKTVFYQIKTDDGKDKITQADTIVYFNLHTGDELTEEQWSSVLLYDEEKTIIQNSINLISRRLRSEKELRDRFIRNGFSETAVDNAIAHLGNQGYLDDGHFALLFAKQIMKKKPVGEIKLRYELRKKGIRESVVDMVLSQFTANYEQNAKQTAQKKLKTMKLEDTEIIRQKLWRFLEQRGFTGDIIRRTVDALNIV